MTNRKTTKRALFSSVVALMLCFTMLMGTTYAWFTDSVTSANNIIQSGNLDIELEYWNGTEWKDVKDASDILTNTLYEPGVTEVAYFKIENVGSLALSYQFGINIVSETTGTNVADETFLLSDSIEFGVIENVNGETGAYTEDEAGRAAAVAAVTDAKKISTGYTKAADLKAGDAPVYLALVVYMPTTVENEANHKTGTAAPTINLGINVLATQFTYESDSFDNQYDKDNSSFVSNVTELKNALATVQDNGTIYLNDGVYDINSQLNISGKSVNIVGVGENAVINMTDTRTNYNKIFYIYGSADGEDITVNISNVTLVADVPTKSDIWVRTDAQDGTKVGGKKVTVNLDNVTCTSVICDNNYVDNDTVNLNIKNSTIGKVTLDASPFNSNGLNTYTNLTYDAATRIDNINIQSGVNDLTHITINGVNPTGNGEQQSKTYVDTIDELQAALADTNVTHIVFGADITGNVVMPTNDNTVTVDGANYKLNGSINLNGTVNKTIKNITFNAAYAQLGYDGKGNAKQYAIIMTGDNTNKPNRGAWDVVIDGCTFTGTFANGGASIEFTDQSRTSGGSGNITIKNCTFDTENAYYDIYGHYCGNGTNGYDDFVIENNTFKTAFSAGGPVYLGRYASSTPVVVKGNTFETVTSLEDAVYVQDHSNYGVSITAESNTFNS